MTTILGQSRAQEILQSALESGRFHHAWIFSGPRGVGKFTTALEIASSLLQTTADQVVGHPDLHVIRKELALYSDDPEIRTRKLMSIPLAVLREHMIGGKVGETFHDAAAYRTSLRGKGKVFIIDEAELLASEGQNAMLKTLEEPPPQTYIFLITNQPDRLLATIRSRAQHVRFSLLDEDSMRKWFDRQRSSFAGASPAAAKWVMDYAEGSPGVAQLAMQYGFFQWHEALGPMLAEMDRGKFPVSMGETIGVLIEEFAQAWVKVHGVKSTSKDAANKDGARHMFSLLARHARAQLARAAEHDEASVWLVRIDLLRDAERELESNVNLKLLLENLVAQWFSGAAAGQTVAA
jgi:DNA polymerase-3 subunit delta'